jgi:hypothetical protein
MRGFEQHEERNHLRAMPAPQPVDDRRPSSRSVTAVVLLMLLAGLALAIAPSAFASKFVHRVVAGGSSGVLQGQFSAPGDVVVNDGSVADGASDPLGDSVDGYVYVVDRNNQRVQVFGPDGGFRFMWGRGVEDGSNAPQVCDSSEVPCTGGESFSGVQGGMFDTPQGIAIDQDTGHVFVRERSNGPSGNRRVQEFEADGTFVRAWGFDVDSSNPSTGFETCLTAASCLRGTSGAGLGQFADTSTGFASGIAVDQASGDAFVADPTNRRVQRFAIPTNPVDPIVAPVSAIGGGGSSPFDVDSPAHVAVADGVLYGSNAVVSGGIFVNQDVLRYDLGSSAFMAPLPVASVTGSDPLAETVGLEADPGSGNLLVARHALLDGGLRFSPVFELGDPGAVSVGDVDHVDTHVNGTNLRWLGFGFDPGSGDLFLTVADAGGQRLFVADDGPAPLALPVFLPPTDVGSDSATVNVSIDPNGPLAVDYKVQVATTSAPEDFQTIVSGQVPDGAPPTAVAAELTGLRPKTLYLVRVVTTKQFGNPSSAVDGPVLLTKAAAPSLAAVHADSVQDTTARLTGRINPNGTAAGYRFEYGIGNFNNTVPVPDAQVGGGYDFRFVSQQLSGLQPGATYQFRLIAISEDSELGETVSATKTFTTKPEAGSQARAFELVSPADKIGGVGVGEWYKGPGSLVPSGFAAHVGERFAAEGSFGSMLLDSPQAYANDWAFADRMGDQAGWVSHTPLVRPNHGGALASFVQIRSASEDLSRLVFGSNNTLKVFPELEEPEWVVDTLLEIPFVASWGGPDTASRWEFWGPTDPSAFRHVLTGTTAWTVGLSADGSRAVGLPQLRTPPGVLTGPIATVRGVAGPGDPTHRNWPDLISGRSVYVADTEGQPADTYEGTGDRVLVNVCTGTAGVDRTLLPGVNGSGDMAGVECPAALAGRDGRLISDRGASLHGDTGGVKPIASRAVSDDGRRVFFLSPDPAAAGVPNGATDFCDSAGETCPPQLYVRQEDGNGDVTTRWVSKAEPGLLGVQDATLTGTARFEGATADGDKVLFRTNSPLTADDPNGTGNPPPVGGVVSGNASNSSWDLYLYDFPDDPDADPGDGVLARVSGGPGGDGDCNSPYNSDGSLDTTAALRFVSRDASRVYFTCTVPLAGAAGGPEGSITTPADGSSPETETNLYLYDANQTDEGQRWRFVARLPRSIVIDAGAGDLDACASTGYNQASPFGGAAQKTHIAYRDAGTANCVRGNEDGSFVTWLTPGRLTADDPVSPATGDMYGFDAEAGTLERISAAQGGVGGSYVCAPGNSAFSGWCNGDPGVNDGNIHLNFATSPLGVVPDPLVAGERLVFFESRARLVAGDTDESYDVYQWRDGALSLISTGTSDHALFKGNDRTGRNVYFVTRDRLSWQDFDDVADIYTARVDGGIDQPAPTPVCGLLAGLCHGGGTAPVEPNARTVAPPGDGDASLGARPQLSVAALGVQARRRAARRGVLALSVRTSTAGTVRAVARARINGRGWTVGRAKTRARSAGRVVLRLRLNGQARQRLRAGRRLRLSVGVGMAGARRQSTAVLLPGAGR